MMKKPGVVIAVKVGRKPSVEEQTEAMLDGKPIPRESEEEMELDWSAINEQIAESDDKTFKKEFGVSKKEAIDMFYDMFGNIVDMCGTESEGMDY